MEIPNELIIQLLVLIISIIITVFGCIIWYIVKRVHTIDLELVRQAGKIENFEKDIIKIANKDIHKKFGGDNR